MAKKSKSSTQTNSTSTVTATPTNPTWVTDSIHATQNRINGLLDVDPQSLVPEASRLQNLAYDQAEALTEQDPLSAATASSRGLLDVDLERYKNPMLNSVVATTLAGADERTGMEAAKLAAQQGLGQKFSNSGSAIERAMFNRGAIQDRAQLEAGLRYGAHDRATALASSDLQREAETSRFNAQAANQMALAQREAEARNIGILSALGGEQREIERQKLGANTELLKLISALNSSQPYNLFRGETRTGNESSTSNSTTKSSDPLGSLAGILGAAGSVASGLGALGVTLSDKRLKTDIETVGRDRSGRRVVSYRYKGEPEGVMRIGHIAQEVEETDPHAIVNVGGRKAIAYGLLEGV